jgi:6-phosphogluconolactonase
MNRPLLFASLLLTASALAVDKPRAGEYFVYFGTYTAGTSKGIYACRFEPGLAKLTALGPVAEVPNPSFLALSPNGRFLYAVNWKGSETVKGDTVSAYSVDRRTGRLTFLNKTDSGGEMPTHLAVDRTGRMLLTVNYGGGSVSAFAIGQDGRLTARTSFDQHQGSSVLKGRQEGPHAHAVVLSGDNRFAFVADLGLDQVFRTGWSRRRHGSCPTTRPSPRWLREQVHGIWRFVPIIGFSTRTTKSTRRSLPLRTIRRRAG